MSLENDTKRAKFETLDPIFIKTYSIEIRCVIGPEDILFAGASVHLSAWKFYRLGQ